VNPTLTQNKPENDPKKENNDSIGTRKTHKGLKPGELIEL